jgi:hypothetical protein
MHRMVVEAIKKIPLFAGGLVVVLYSIKNLLER